MNDRPVGLLRRIWNLLGQQRTGVVLALVSAGLLGCGSLVMDNAAETYGALRMDDLRFFFEPMRWQYSWLYALMLSLALWATSALVCTWDSVASRIRRRVTRPSAYGAPLVHVTFVLGLIAHLWGGLRTTTAEFEVSSDGTEIRGQLYRAVSVDSDTYPNGMPRATTLTLERSSAQGTQTVTLGYNQPLTSHWGSQELLLMQVDTMPDGLLLRHKGQRVVLRGDTPMVVAGDTITLLAFHDPRISPSLRVPVVELLVGQQRLMLPLEPDGTGETVFLGANEQPVAMLVERDNPSVPLVLLMAALLVIGVVLVAWERMAALMGSSAASRPAADA